MADEFKKKYYDVLGNNPRLFARFFKEDSTLTVAVPDAKAQTADGPEVRQPAARRHATALVCNFGLLAAAGAWKPVHWAGWSAVLVGPRLLRGLF